MGIVRGSVSWVIRLIMSDSNLAILVSRLNSHPVLCWVTNEHARKPTISLVTSFVDGRFYTDTGDGFNFARALSINDVQRYSLGYMGMINE